MRKNRALAGIALVGCLGCLGPNTEIREYRIAPDGFLLRGSGDTCRDRALLRSSELAIAEGYPYFTAATPPTVVSSDCEVHVRLFRERPECDHALFYDAAITRKSLESELSSRVSQ